MSRLSTQNIYLTKLVNDLGNFNADRIALIEKYVDKVVHSGIVDTLIKTHEELMKKGNRPLYNDYTAVKSDLMVYLENRKKLNIQLKAEDPWFRLIPNSSTDKDKESLLKASEHVRDVLFEAQAILSHPKLIQGIEILKKDIQSLMQDLDEYTTLLPNQDKEMLKFKRHLAKLENNLNHEEFSEALLLSCRLAEQLKKMTQVYENSSSSPVQTIENKPHKRTKSPLYENSSSSLEQIVENKPNKRTKSPSFIQAFLKKIKKI